MTAPDPADEVPGELPDVGELLAIVEQLDEDNERLRVRVLELLDLMEDAVTAQVAAERRADELAERVRGLEVELAAVEDTRIMRLTRPLRSAYARLRGGRGAVGG